jgi:hypothetical protein
MSAELSVPAPAAPSTTTLSPSVWARWFNVDKRYLAPILITCILAAGQVSFGFLESYARTALAITIALLLMLTDFCSVQATRSRASSSITD